MNCWSAASTAELVQAADGDCTMFAGCHEYETPCSSAATHNSAELPEHIDNEDSLTAADGLGTTVTTTSSVAVHASVWVAALRTCKVNAVVWERDGKVWGLAALGDCKNPEGVHEYNKPVCGAAPNCTTEPWHTETSSPANATGFSNMRTNICVLSLSLPSTTCDT